MPNHRDDDPTYGWLAGLESKAAGPAPVSDGFSYGWGDYSSSRVEVPSYLNAVVAIGIGWLKRNFPVADLRVIKNDGSGKGDEIEGHPFIALMDRPNPVDDFFSFCSPFLLSDVVDGNTFYIKVRDNGRRIHSLWWVPPWDVEIVPNRDRQASAERPISHYEIRVNGRVTDYDPEDVIHIKDGKDPLNPLRGLADLKAGKRAESTVNYTEMYTQTLMMNCGAIPTMLSPANPQEQIQPEDVERLRSQYDMRQNGQNNGKPFVAVRGLKVDRLGSTPEEMALDKLPERAVASLCALIGVPAMVTGLPDPGKTYSNLGQALQAAWDNGLKPRQARFAEAFDRQCPELIHPTRERLDWDYSRVPALNDFNAKVDALVKAVGKPFMTQEEAREKCNLPPLTPEQEAMLNPPPPPQLVAPANPALPTPRPPAALPAPAGKSIEREDDADPFPRRR